MRKRSGLALLGSAFALLLAAWVFATPPFDAPDETAHYLRAVGIANRTLLGPKVPYRAPTAEQTAWVIHDARGVLVTPLLSPPNYPCLVDNRPDVRPPGCLEATYTGDYEPLPYLLPALAINTTGSVHSALWLSRIAAALPCFAFLLLALVLLWSGSSWSVLGLLAAITPTALFIGSMINSNGLEIAASLAFTAGVLRASRRPIAAPARWVWGALAVSGAVTVLAWQLGWVFVLADTAILGALLGRDGWRELNLTSRSELRVTALVLLAACGGYLIYGLSAGLLHGAFGVTPIGASLHQGLHQLRQVFYGAVGVFGALTVGLPSASYWVWWLLVIALVAGALVWVRPRERVVMLSVIVVALAFPVLFYAWIFRHSGFGLQARYVMPVLALIPLLAGELIFRSDPMPQRTTWSWLPSRVVTVVAGFSCSPGGSTRATGRAGATGCGFSAIPAGARLGVGGPGPPRRSLAQWPCWHLPASRCVAAVVRRCSMSGQRIQRARCAVAPVSGANGIARREARTRARAEPRVTRGSPAGAGGDHGCSGRRRCEEIS